LVSRQNLLCNYPECHRNILWLSLGVGQPLPELHHITRLLRDRKERVDGEGGRKRSLYYEHWVVHEENYSDDLEEIEGSSRLVVYQRYFNVGTKTEENNSIVFK
jgi:hypothetical protein